jgi:hypothetical protein
MNPATYLTLAAVALALIAVAARVGYHLGRASAKAEQAIHEEVDQPRDQFGMQVRPNLTCPAGHTYDLTIGDTVYRRITVGKLAGLLFTHDVPSYLVDQDRGDTTMPDGLRITWQPTTDTGETR